jgi:hypothetical protein
MTTSGRADDASRTALNLGAGRPASDTPGGPVPFEQDDGAITVEVALYVEEAGGAIPGLLGSTLSEAGLVVGYVDPSADAGEPALLAAMDRDGRIPAASLATALTRWRPTTVSPDRGPPGRPDHQAGDVLSWSSKPALPDMRDWETPSARSSSRAGRPTTSWRAATVP